MVAYREAMGTARTLAPTRGGFIELLERMLAPAATDAAWAEGVVETATSLFSTASLVNVQVVEYDSFGRSRRCGLAVPEHPTRALLETTIAEGHPICPAGVRFISSPTGQTALTVVAHPLPGVVTAIGAIYERKPQLQQHERVLLSQIALHLDAAHRLRLRPRAIVGVLGENGELLERSPEAPAPAQLAAQVAKIKQARSLARRHDPASMRLWSSLVDGRVSLVPRSTGSRTEYLVLDNPHETLAFRALTPQEASALLLATQGISNKLVAYGLGVAPSAASTLLATAAAKMGLASRAELLRVAALITRDERSDMTEAVLTGAEREILSLLEAGLSNERIAKERSRSIRTIANQVASLLRKTGASSRRELLLLSARSRAGAQSH